MRDQIERLQITIQDLPKQVKAIGPGSLEAKPDPDRWSKKEILGHLIDSALNNIQRFIRAQHGDTIKIIYQQDQWVKTMNYQRAPLDLLIDLWTGLNQQLVRVWDATPIENLDLESDIGKDQPEIMNLYELAADYNRHLEHHQQQILS